MEEGGLGIHDLFEVQDSLHMKFAWKLIKGDMMWSNFFTTKYVGNSHIYSVMALWKGTRFWMGIMHLMPSVLCNLKWLICRGWSNFWMDNWLGDGPLMASNLVVGNEQLQLSEIIDETGPKLHVIQELVPDVVLQKI